MINKFLKSFCILTLLTFTACGGKNKEVENIDKSASDSTINTLQTTIDIHDSDIKDNTLQTNNLYTPIDTITYNGIPIKSTNNFSEEQKKEILEAYTALEVFFDKYLNINYPNGSQYITSIDDVRYNHDLFTHYDSEIYDFVPEKEIEFYVTCADNDVLSSSRKNTWYLVSKIDGKWTTYSEYMDK